MSNPFAPPSPHTLPSLPNAELADAGVRFVAVLVDRMALWLPAIALALPVGLVTVDRLAEDTMVLAVLGTGLLWVLPLTVVQWVLAARHGQSIGKRLMGIRAVRDDGLPPDFLTMVVMRQWVIGLVNLVVQLFCSVGVLAIVDPLFIFSSDRKCLHDRIAGTSVVKVPHDPSL